MLRLCRLKERPTAVFISNYDMTIGAYLAINYLNLKIPEDISVIGFDNFPLANVVNPPLSFAEQPVDLMGLNAAKLLFKRIQGDYSDYPQAVSYTHLSLTGVPLMYLDTVPRDKPESAATSRIVDAK